MINNREDVVTSNDLNNLFEICCQNGYIDIVKFLYEIDPNTIMKCATYSNFLISCRNNHLNMICMMYELNPFMIPSNNIFNDIHIKGDYFNLDTLIWIANILKKLDFSSRYFMSIGTVCRMNYPDTFYWLYALDKDAFEKNLYGIQTLFTDACESGKLDIAKGLYHIDQQLENKISIHYSIISKVCHHGYLRIVMWLYDLYGNKFDEQIDKLFIDICSINQDNFKKTIRIAQWLAL